MAIEKFSFWKNVKRLAIIDFNAIEIINAYFQSFRLGVRPLAPVRLHNLEDHLLVSDLAKSEDKLMPFQQHQLPGLPVVPAVLPLHWRQGQPVSWQLDDDDKVPELAASSHGFSSDRSLAWQARQKLKLRLSYEK